MSSGFGFAVGLAAATALAVAAYGCGSGPTIAESSGGGAATGAVASSSSGVPEPVVRYGDGGQAECAFAGFALTQPDPANNLVLALAPGGGVVVGIGTLYGDVVVIASIADDCSVRWSHTIAPGGILGAIAVAASGNVVLTGLIAEGQSVGGAELTPDAGTAFFVAEMTPDGTPVFGKSFPTEPGAEPLGAFPPRPYTRTAVDSDGEIVMAGYIGGAIDFGCGSLPSAPGAEVGDTDAYVVRFRADGTCRFSYRFGDASFQGIDALTMAPSGRAYVGGGFAGTMTVGAVTLSSGDTGGEFIFWVDPDGTLGGVLGFGTGEVGWLAYSAGGLGVIGSAGPPSTMFAGQSLDSDGGVWFAASVDPTYQQGWVSVFPGGGVSGSVIPLGRDADGGTVVSAVIGVPWAPFTDLGGGPIAAPTLSTQTRGVLAKYDPTGHHVHSMGFGGVTSAIYDLAVEADGHTFVAGIGSNVDLGNGVTVDNPPGGAFVARFAP